MLARFLGAQRIHRLPIQYGNLYIHCKREPVSFFATQEVDGNNSEQINLQSAHHTVSCKDGVVDRVGADEALISKKLNLEDMEIVNMRKVFPNALLSKVGIPVADDKVASCTSADLVADVRCKNELLLAPLHGDLSK